MEFVFVCPRTGDTFSSSDFRIEQYRGIKTDDGGNKTLDAAVVLTEPCPICGRKHVYRADELACPFENQK